MLMLTESVNVQDQLLLTPSGDRELESLCFLFANYVNVPRVPQSNIFIEEILPIYKQAHADSPLKIATTAVAANISEMWKMKGPDSDFSRRAYSRAVTSLRNSFSDPRFSDNAEFVLASIFMLDFYESLSRRFKHTPDMDMHLKAAMALMEQKGKDGFVSESSKRIFTALRGRYILFSLQARKKVELGHNLLFIDENNGLPSAKLDLIMAKIANLLYDSQNLVIVEAHPFAFTSWDNQEPARSNMNYELMLHRCLEINMALDEWQERLPVSWQPIRNTKLESIHHSIRAVGLYNGLCDVYSSTSVPHAYNGWRSNKILVMRLIKHCLQHLPPSPSNAGLITSAEADGHIQAFVDDTCASVPFLLGSRTSITLPHEHAEYPPVPLELRESANYVDSTGRPTTMTDQDHSRAAASIGGWFLLTPLTVILAYCQPLQSQSRMSTGPFAARVPMSENLVPVKLRNGQLEWILGQVKRIHKLYTIPLKVELSANSNVGTPEPVQVGSPTSDEGYSYIIPAT